ncbi:arsenate reductase (glutaredoxin) [Catenovulum sp. 2E275]|uniref:arsenate reductase (glutaredoxin) n=1 Tax=Catenovulum sp. 2E275 TaxID=2980497 RepID=UPI0021D2AB11|nr:arsenate reductase (glutaredoxin) [Catenovulum sp. 2E275]MCU4676966.1 arsenate reductase (glutaredoxin) [Catenovulum sp. 2E275]
MSNYIIYHNPRCSKSRETLALLQEHGIEPEVILYLDTPPSIEALAELATKLNVESVHDFIRDKEAIYKELDLDDLMSDEELLPLMNEYPKLIERPIVVKGDKAVIGRPPENVLSLINQ